MVAWVVVEVVGDAVRASKGKDCHRVWWLELEWPCGMELEMLDVVKQGVSQVVGMEKLVQYVAVVAALSVVLVR